MPRDTTVTRVRLFVRADGVSRGRWYIAENATGEAIGWTCDRDGARRGCFVTTPQSVRRVVNDAAWGVLVEQPDDLTIPRCAICGGAHEMTEQPNPGFGGGLLAACPLEA